MGLAFETVHQGDCVALLKKMDAGSVDLAFADPPFNIKYEYDVYKDNRPYHEYLDWTREWMGEVSRVLKPNGTFWAAIGDEYAAEFKLIMQNDLKLTCRSWVIWYYTFGVNCKRKFTRSHAHLFHFVKDAKNFTFNFADPELRVPSARQMVYGDKRAVGSGRLPDDTWILRPQDLPEGFEADSDTWYFARVAGTFKEREGFHGCQMPEQLLGRIIRACSNPGEVVLDPFAGSSTTLAVAKKLGRAWVGCELSKDYAKKGNRRLAKIAAGEPLNGAADPLTSAPTTAAGRRLGATKATAAVKVKKNESLVLNETTRSISNGSIKPEDKKSFESGLLNAFQAAHDGYSIDRVILADPDLNQRFLDQCVRAGLSGTPVDWNRAVLRLRKSQNAKKFKCHRRTDVTWNDMDEFSFASEIAWEIVSNAHGMLSLDEILCDPRLASEFDTTASRFAPNFKPFDYRWAALKLRKKGALDRSQLDKDAMRRAKSVVLRPVTQRSQSLLERAPISAYILKLDDVFVFAGETVNLGRRIRQHMEVGKIEFSQFGFLKCENGSDNPAPCKFALARNFNTKFNSIPLLQGRHSEQFS